MGLFSCLFPSFVRRIIQGCSCRFLDSRNRMVSCPRFGWFYIPPTNACLVGLDLRSQELDGPMRFPGSSERSVRSESAQLRLRVAMSSECGRIFLQPSPLVHK